MKFQKIIKTLNSSLSTPVGLLTLPVKESLECSGEALAENGKVIVTGCLGAKKLCGW
jgi:hypothetical protein